MNYDQRFQGGGGRAAPPAVRNQAPSVPIAAPNINMSDMAAMKIGGVAIVPSSMKEISDFALTMSQAGTMLRKHLRDRHGSCLAIAMQAFRWGFDPFMVAAKSFEVNDQVAYEAQLLAAVIIRNAPIKGRPRYTYTGDGATRRCTVSVELSDGSGVLEYQSPPKGQIKPQNSPLWISDPDQQLGYYSIRALSRRHFPDILMGVYDVEEAETMRDITPESERPTTPKPRITDALDGLARRRAAATVIDQGPGPEPEPEPEGGEGFAEMPAHDEDGVIDEGECATVRGADGEFVEDADADGDGAAEAPAIVIPEMPAEALAMWTNRNRWSPAWKWLSGLADQVESRVLAHVLLTHDDVLKAAASHNDAGKQAVEELKRKAGLE